MSNQTKPESRYIVNNESFNGSILSETYFEDGSEYVAYSGYLYNNKGPDLSVIDYIEKRKSEGKSIKVIDKNELDSLFDQYEKSLITPAIEISKERFYEMFEILPPCKWNNSGTIEYFHISERLYGNIVSWYVRYFDRFFNFHDFSNIAASKIRSKVDDAISGDT